MDQLLTWVANGTNDYPSQEVIMTMQALMEMIRLSDPKVLEELLHVITDHVVVPGNGAIGSLKLYDVLFNCALIIIHFDVKRQRTMATRWSCM